MKKKRGPHPRDFSHLRHKIPYKSPTSFVGPAEGEERFVFVSYFLKWLQKHVRSNRGLATPLMYHSWVGNPGVWHEVHMGWQPRVRRCAFNGAEKADWQPLFPSSAFTMCVRKTHRQATHFGRPPMVVVLARAERTSLDLVANHQCSTNLGFPDLSISFHTCIACRNVLFISSLNTSGSNGLFFPSILGTLSPF